MHNILFDPELMQGAFGSPRRAACVRPAYSIWERNLEARTIPVLLELGIGLPEGVETEKINAEYNNGLLACRTRCELFRGSDISTSQHEVGNEEGPSWPGSAPPHKISTL